MIQCLVHGLHSQHMSLRLSGRFTIVQIISPPHRGTEVRSSGHCFLLLFEPHCVIDMIALAHYHHSVSLLYIPMYRRGAGPSRREQPAFEWDQTVHESQVESGDCKQQ